MSWSELERSVADVEADASLQRAWQLVFVLLSSPSCLAFSYISAICMLPGHGKPQQPCGA